MKDYYLLTTEHLEDCLWFREDSDFKVAMNYVAIQAACCPDVDVLAFILMSNHVHFVLFGNKEDTIQFVEHFKKRYSLYYESKYGVQELLRRNKVDVRIVPYNDDSLERAIAYVMMNSVAANICSHPSQYPWGSGNYIFNQSLPTGNLLGDFSKRAVKRMLHSDFICLPEDWRINSQGYINPQEYVNVSAVETIFRSPKRMNYFFNSSSKAKKRMETGEDNLPSFNDQTILNVLPDLCKSLFQKTSFKMLQEGEQTELARQLRFRFSSDANQIARVCGLTYDQAARLLDSC